MRRRKSKGPVRAKAVKADGINFKSGLERYCYLALKKAKLFEGYENEKFALIDGFSFSNESYERQANGKGAFTERGGGKKILGISYTPDFCGKDYICETKGRPNESFPLRWKLFKRRLALDGDIRTVYKPQNQKEIDLMVELIKQKRKDGKGSK